MELWCVKVAYYYGDESYQNTLDIDVNLYRDKDVAIKMLEETIRSNWTCEVETEDGVKALADCRGMSEVADDPKYSSWHYSEDGMRAWCFFTDGHGYKGEVVKLEVPS